MIQEFLDGSAGCAHRLRTPSEIADLEQAIFGCDHAAIGGLLFAMWGLPENIVRATTWHHEPAAFASNEFCYVTLLHFANSAAHVIHEMPFYCGDELIPEVAAKARLPIEYVQELD